jgi:hypothetical protein
VNVDARSCDEFDIKIRTRHAQSIAMRRQQNVGKDRHRLAPLGNLTAEFGDTKLMAASAA